MTLNIIRNRVGNNKIIKGKSFVKHTFYKHGKRDYITTNSAKGRANRIATPQKRLCPCPKIGNNQPKESQIPEAERCCPVRQMIRSGVNSNVTLNSKGKYEQNTNKTYYHNASQRLHARKMSFKTNMPTQKNNTLNKSCCRSENGKFKESYSKSSACCAPVDKSQHGLRSGRSNERKLFNVPAKSDSGARTFALRHASNTVFNQRNTEEEKKPNKNIKTGINKKQCYRR